MSGRILTSLITIILFNTVMGQRLVDNQGIFWVSYNNNVKITPKATLFLDGQFRYAADPEPGKFLEPMQVLLRTHLDLPLKGLFSFSPLGYCRVFNHLYGVQPASIINQEHRFYQQLAANHTAGKIRINHRLRTEERFLQDHNQQGDNLGYINKQFRVRYRFMATVPLNKQKIEPGAITSTFFYEGFISRGARVTFSDIDQNRLYLGFGMQINKNLALSTGAFYQMLIKANGAKQENNVGLMIMLNQSIDLTRKQD